MASTENIISLRFGLQEGSSADLDAILDATKQWSRSVKLAARFIDPDAKVYITFEGADEGSRIINTIIKYVESPLKKLDEETSEVKRTRGIFLGLCIFLVGQVSGFALEEYFDDDEISQRLSEDRELYERCIDHFSNEPEFKETGRVLFSKLLGDPNITSIGVSEGPTSPPIVRVPSKEFAGRSGTFFPPDMEERIRKEVMTVRLFKPALINDRRSWEFWNDENEKFRAVMRDDAFLAALENGEVHENIQTDIEMTLEVEISEIFVDGEWILKKRGKRKGMSVSRVISPDYGRSVLPPERIGNVIS